jgi:23S rRNA-/tRNA-specific pseudouridylate synthase
MRWLVAVMLLVVAQKSIPLACGLRLPAVFTSYKASIRFPVLHSLRSSVTSEELLKDPQFRSNGQWTAKNSQNGLKLSEFLNAVAPQLFTSTTASKNAIRKGLIRLNGLKAKNGDLVVENDVVDSFIRSQQGVFCSDFERKAAVDPSEFDLCIVPVLWEDNHCAVVIKPQGMPVFRTKDGNSMSSHDSSSNLKNPCLQTALPYSLLPIPADSDLQPLRRPQAVHRLDKGTGGLIIVAKTLPALVHLTAQFSNRTVVKKYKAVVAGKLTGDSDNSKFSEMEISQSHPATAIGGVITNQLSGQSAETEWSVEPGMQTQSPLYGWITTVDLSPHTGRTHQLRR